MLMARDQQTPVFIPYDALVDSVARTIHQFIEDQRIPTIGRGNAKPKWEETSQQHRWVYVSYALKAVGKMPIGIYPCIDLDPRFWVDGHLPPFPGATDDIEPEGA